MSEHLRIVTAADKALFTAMIMAGRDVYDKAIMTMAKKKEAAKRKSVPRSVSRRSVINASRAQTPRPGSRQSTRVRNAPIELSADRYASQERTQPPVPDRSKVQNAPIELSTELYAGRRRTQPPVPEWAKAQKPGVPTRKAPISTFSGIAPEVMTAVCDAQEKNNALMRSVSESPRRILTRNRRTLSPSLLREQSPSRRNPKRKCVRPAPIDDVVQLPADSIPILQPEVNPPTRELEDTAYEIINDASDVPPQNTSNQNLCTCSARDQPNSENQHSSSCLYILGPIRDNLTWLKLFIKVHSWWSDPSEDVKKKLAEATGKTYLEVCDWFAAQEKPKPAELPGNMVNLLEKMAIPYFPGDPQLSVKETFEKFSNISVKKALQKAMVNSSFAGRRREIEVEERAPQEERREVVNDDDDTDDDEGPPVLERMVDVVEHVPQQNVSLVPVRKRGKTLDPSTKRPGVSVKLMDLLPRPRRYALEGSWSPVDYLMVGPDEFDEWRHYTIEILNKVIDFSDEHQFFEDHDFFKMDFEGRTYTLSRYINVWEKLFPNEHPQYKETEKQLRERILRRKAFLDFRNMAILNSTKLLLLQYKSRGHPVYYLGPPEMPHLLKKLVLPNNNSVDIEFWTEESLRQFFSKIVTPRELKILTNFGIQPKHLHWFFSLDTKILRILNSGREYFAESTFKEIYVHLRNIVTYRNMYGVHSQPYYFSNSLY